MNSRTSSGSESVEAERALVCARRLRFEHHHCGPRTVIVGPAAKRNLRLLTAVILNAAPLCFFLTKFVYYLASARSIVKCTCVKIGPAERRKHGQL